MNKEQYLIIDKAVLSNGLIKKVEELQDDDQQFLENRLAGMADVVFLLSELLEDYEPELTERVAYAIYELNIWRNVFLEIKLPYDAERNYEYELDVENDLANENITMKTLN